MALPLPVKRQLAFAAIMAAIMTGVVSLVVTLVNAGLTADLMSRWLKSYAIAFICAAPIIYFAAPVVRAWVDRKLK